MPLLTDRVKILLLAGGRGERFWPRSTRALPKQFLQVDGRKSLLRKTFERLLPVVDPRAVYVVTGKEHEALTRRELPELTGDQVILEPVGRNTAPALGLGALWLSRLEPESVLLALPSDHHIVGEAEFHAALAVAVQAAEEGVLVTLGVAPDRPETGYGYIRTGPRVKEIAGLPLLRSAGFTEKPDAGTAARYCQSGEFLWNSGIVVSRSQTLLAEIALYLPEVHKLLAQMDRTAATLQELRTQVQARFAEMPSISIDYGVLERSAQVLTIPVSFGWTDVLTIVDPPQALLVCAREKAQEVSQVTPVAAAAVEALALQQQPAGDEIPHPWGREICWAATERYG